jgi:serine/threonine protein kinase
MAVCTTCGTSYGPTVRVCLRDGTALATEARHQYLGTLIDGKYRIESFISAGSMGSVYRAVHVMLDKVVAVKVIKSELVTSDELVARFQREARAASNLHHPNIVSVYDLGHMPDGTLYIAMEYIDGPSVKQFIRQNGPLTPLESIDLVRQVASALAAAHRKQIVHRDLKSDNLMLASVEGRRIVKLVDFGIAKTFDESTDLTVAGYLLGTAHYMSPEQAAGKAVDHRADLYSLGVILYETITGSVPFDDASLGSVLVRLATEVPAAPSTRRFDVQVPPALDAVALRCLEKDPERRFQSANELAHALAQTALELEGVPIGPKSVPATARTIVRPQDQQSSAHGEQAAADISAARLNTLRARRSRWTVATVLLVVGTVIATLITGVRPFQLRDEGIGRSTTTEERPVVSTEPVASARPAAAAERTTLPADVATVPPARSSASVENEPRPVPEPDRSPTPKQGQTSKPASPPYAAPDSSASESDSNAATAPNSPAAVTVTPPRAEQMLMPLAKPRPTISTTCRGFQEVCVVLGAEMVRALQADGFPVVAAEFAADLEIRTTVTLVSEAPSVQFGTPVTLRTYSIELTGNSRSQAVVMPSPRIFQFDPVFSRATLQENVRIIAVGAVDAVRAFTNDPGR